MTSEPRRDPLADHLITPENAVLVVIDYQQEMLSNVTSVDQAELTNAVTGLVRTAKAFNVPTVFSTVAVEMGFNQDTIQPISDAMGETTPDAHQQAMARLTAAGAIPTTWGVVLAELQRDYTRTDSLSDVVDILGSHLFTAQREAVAV
jgi:hypothetical protein